MECDRPGCEEQVSHHKARFCKECIWLVGPTKQFSSALSNMVDRPISRGKYEVSVTSQDVLAIWPKDNCCPVMGTVFRQGEPRTDSPSLDRIDSSLGYVPGNIQVISDLANKMKQNASEEQMVKFAEWVLQ